MHLLLYYVALIPGPQERRKLILLPGSVVQCIIIISKKKRLVYMHIVIYNYCYNYSGLPGPQEKYDSARRIWILDITHGE